jgi:Mrp family chromosome partitioning ATPase
LSNSADFVVIDAGAVLGTADAVAARASADQAIIAIDTGRSTRKDLIASVEQLEIIGTPLLGIVVAKRRRRAKGQRVELAAATSKPAPAESPDRILSS